MKSQSVLEECVIYEQSATMCQADYM